jgi:hypothetical protein
MGDDQNSTLQTLAAVLSGGLQGYVDSQNQQPVYVTAPSPQTAYGYAGQGQSTPAASAVGVFGIPPAFLLVGAVALFFFMKK